MTDQPLKLSGVFAIVMRQYLRDRNAGIIITDAVGNTSEEIKCSDMGFHKSLRAFTGKRHHKHRIGMNHAHHEKHDFSQYVAKLDNRLTEVNLSFARSLT